MAKLLVAPLKNAVQKTLAAQLLNTAGVGDPITFDDVDGIPNLPGVLVINRVDSSGAATASKREYIEYSGTSGNTVLITTRNVDNSNAALTHAVGSIVEFIPDVTWADRIYDALSVVTDVDDVTAVNTTNVVTPTGTQTLTNKTISGGLISGATLTGIKISNSDITLGTINSSGATISAILDDDTMAAASATTLATSESVKAYVDSRANTDGWTTVSDTWTYASASTFTIAGVDRTAVYTKGTRLKFTQTTVKYAVVLSSSFSTNTTVTIAVNTDYTIANAAITAPFYSYQVSPQGYPTTFSWTATWGGFSSNPTGTFKYSILGNTCTMYWSDSASGTSNAATLTFTIPVDPARNLSGISCFITDSGTNATTPGHIALVADVATASVFKTFFQGTWTSSGNKNFYIESFTFDY